MKRSQKEISITKRNWLNHKKMHGEFSVRCACHKQGYFRKRDAYDCGITRCFICHSDKYPKREDTRQEWVSDQKFKEGLEEI